MSQSLERPVIGEPSGKAAPDEATRLFQRGLALGKDGDLAGAISCYDEAIALAPDFAHAWYNRANMRFRLGQYELAVADYRRYTRFRPDQAGPFNNLGLALKRLGDHESALESFDRASMLDPSSISILQNRANLLLDLDRAQAALEDADRAVALRPENASSHHIRGNCLRILEQPELALEAYRTALQLAPKDSVIHFCHATVLHMLGHNDEAIVGFGEAIALQPDYVEARVNRSILLLLKGDLKAGFQDHEWRYRREIWPDRRWRGDQPLAGKTILLHCDDGLGDTIQFCRYAPLLADQGAIVTLAPQRPLMALMSTLDPRVKITVPQVIRSEPAYDLHCPLLSVPAALGTTLETIPRQVPYLSAEPERLARWRARIGGEGLRIGVCWQGSTNAYDVGRSFPIAQMADIARMQGVRLISLHKGAGEAQLDALPSGMKLEVFADLDAEGGAFLDTAAVMLGCDLVITSDTAVAHLAGALGVETWVALRKVPAWRWLLDRPDTPWYPTMTLFRQETDGDWSGLFSRMSTRLRERLGAP